MTDSAAGRTDRTPAQIRADIAATRVELQQTVDAMSAKLDVTSRTRSWVQDPANRPQLIAAGVALASILGLVIIKKVRA